MGDLLNTLCCKPPAFSDAQAKRVAYEAFGLVGSAKSLGGERDRNFLLCTDTQCVLIKVANPAEPADLLAFQCAALRHIEQQDPELPVPRLIQTLDGRDWACTDGRDGAPYRVRAFHFLAGKALKDVPDDPRLMHTLGRTLARLNRALRGFFHAAADHPLAWDLKRLGALAHLVSTILDPKERKLVARVLKRFERYILPELGGLRAQVIHNDVSFHNVVVDPDARLEINGIFDFGDMIHAPLIQDLAVTAAEVPLARVDPIAYCAQIVAGFHSLTPLESEELRLLPDLIAARLALAMILDSWCDNHITWDDDRDHLDGWRPDCVALLQQISAMDPGRLEGTLRAACGMPANPIRSDSKTTDWSSIWHRRIQRLGNARVVSYDQPLHVVRGEGVWLHGADGKAYLDAYNNVPHVGHCHPRVVTAVVEQTATLNTNTRYLYDSILSYSEQLVATLPPGLDVCYFVSSGSEANDLAWRLAKAYTGQQGGVVLEDAYHGVTDAVFELSPSARRDPQKVSSHIATLPAPDDYRGRWRRDIDDRGYRYAELCDDALADLKLSGFAPAALFMDAILSSSGIFVPPPGYLHELFGRMRAAGGLCVADEVQSGFGRTGKQMWGFEVDHVVPDIVTLGKPIANGYPMGLVVTTREIADRFEHQTEFFSTTGGNPVACVAAQAVLDVILNDNLLDHADRVGTSLSHAIVELAKRHPLIGDVRGSGLFIGVELVKDQQSQVPATDETETVVDYMRHAGVLIGREGGSGNVLKIRPPMVFNDEHADLLLQTLDRALSACG